jgi:hypothetical protein
MKKYEVHCLLFFPFVFSKAYNNIKMAAGGLGFHPHLPGFTHRFVGKALGATMWFWMMYRAKEDGPVLLVKISKASHRILF